MCGQKINCTSATPWQSATMDSEGDIIKGICLHGIEFDFSPFRMEEQVEILKGDIWTGTQGKVKHKATSGEIGVEIKTEEYGLVTIWILPENLKRI